MGLFFQHRNKCTKWIIFLLSCIKCSVKTEMWSKLDSLSFAHKTICLITLHHKLCSLVFDFVVLQSLILFCENNVVKERWLCYKDNYLMPKLKLNSLNFLILWLGFFFFSSQLLSFSKHPFCFIIINQIRISV